MVVNRGALGCAALFALVLAIAVALPWLLGRTAQARLEKAVGPLRAERFMLPAAPPGAPGPRLLAALRTVWVSKAEKELLGRSARAGFPGALAERSRLTALLAQQEDALGEVCALDAGASSLNIDYTAEDVQFPNFLPALHVARLVYLRGLLAAADRDPAGLASAARCLGREAALLEGEPELFIQLLGLFVEKLQLTLLAGQAAGATDLQAWELARSLLSNDLRERYRRAVALSATQLDTGVRALIEKQRFDSGGGEPEDWTSRFVGRFVSGWTARALRAAALDRYRLYDQAYDHDYAWMRRELVKEPGKMGLWEKTGKVGGLDDTDLPAIYRATAASRKLVSACLGGSSSGIVSLGNPDGSRTLRTPDGGDYLKLFAPQSLPIPQECKARK
jgi:hypothetical protein